MALFAPHRVLGQIASDVPFSMHKRGTGNLRDDGIGSKLSHLRLQQADVGHARADARDRRDGRVREDFTFCTCGGKIYCSRRVHTSRANW